MDSSEPGRPPERSAGILLHPTSLPAPCGIGDLGPTAYAWVDALARARQSWWQILPLGQTGYGDSPYQSFSAFAGNPNLISPELLAREGLLNTADYASENWPADQVDYERVIPYKAALTARAWDNFQFGRGPALKPAFEEFRSREAAWLDDFALFLALKEAHGGVSWYEWPEELILRQPVALQRARQELAEAMEVHRFRQFLFAHQWAALKQYARERGIRLIGDVPIFVAADSADVWTHPELFQLDERRRRGRGVGRAAGLFLPNGSTLGQSAVPLGGPSARRLCLVDGPACGRR